MIPSRSGAAIQQRTYPSVHRSPPRPPSNAVSSLPEATVPVESASKKLRSRPTKTQTNNSAIIDLQYLPNKTVGKRPIIRDANNILHFRKLFDYLSTSYFHLESPQQWYRIQPKTATALNSSTADRFPGIL